MAVLMRQTCLLVVTRVKNFALTEKKNDTDEERDLRLTNKRKVANGRLDVTK